MPDRRSGSLRRAAETPDEASTFAHQHLSNRGRNRIASVTEPAHNVTGKVRHAGAAPQISEAPDTPKIAPTPA